MDSGPGSEDKARVEYVYANEPQLWLCVRLNSPPIGAVAGEGNMDHDDDEGEVRLWYGGDADRRRGSPSQLP